MGFGDWWRVFSCTVTSRRPHRPTVADRLRARLQAVEAAGREAAADRDVWKDKAARLQRRVAELEAETQDQAVQVRKLTGDVDVLNTQVEGMAKVIASWEARADAATARASLRIAAAQRGGLSHGKFGIDRD